MKDAQFIGVARTKVHSLHAQRPTAEVKDACLADNWYFSCAGAISYGP